MTTTTTQHPHTLSPLPDPFRSPDGQRVANKAQWPSRRREILDQVLALEYGGLPPTPDDLRIEPLHTYQARRFGPDVRYGQYRLLLGEAPSFHFRLELLHPDGKTPCPVILTGDDCYVSASDEICRALLARGYALALFNRTEIVPDLHRSDRDQGLYLVHPELSFGAIAAWAWGYHRAVDALTQIECADAERIAITGHSRGGKTVLLAGATDERIAVTAPNASGCGGTGSFLCQGAGCERLADIIRAVPYWFGPRLPEFVDREPDLGFDQHFLISCVAPRPFINTCGVGDHWANPSGTWQNLLAARAVYRFLGAEDHIGWSYRPGGHDHGTEDWGRMLDFLGWHWEGIDKGDWFQAWPYPDHERAFTWQAPQAP